jgi:hypothetical protein
MLSQQGFRRYAAADYLLSMSNLNGGGGLFDEVGPPLQHSAAMGEVYRSIIGASHLAIIGVGKLCFDSI